MLELAVALLVEIILAPPPKILNGIELWVGGNDTRRPPPKCQPTLISTMEDLCEEWLIGILAITARLGSREEKKAYIAIHKQYMTNLAEMERDAAKQAAHDTCPLTFRPYQVMATMFQSAMHDLSISIIDSIMAGEVTNMRIPSPHEINLARYLGRTMVEWQIAYFLMEPRHMKEYLAPLRNRFFSMSSHSRVPNYRCELSEVFSERRKELADYSSRGLIPRPFRCIIIRFQILTTTKNGKTERG
ncbi:hypothetical protein B0H10DRAFT_1967753 [Mycena sp. CBHHK59/15]|nr:hypothetical protein B0H10DRAFT_1967753 [Mycena sp. CBHHK59/15]